MLKFWDPRALKFLNYGALGAPKWGGGGLFSHGTDRARVRKKKSVTKAVEFNLAENPIRAAIFIFLGVGEVLGSESHPGYTNIPCAVCLHVNKLCSYSACKHRLIYEISFISRGRKL